MMTALKKNLSKLGNLAKATCLAATLGVIEMIQTSKGRRTLGVIALVAITAGVVIARPVRSIPAGTAAVRVNRLTGGMSILDEGWCVKLPFVHELRTYPLHDQVYRPAGTFQSSEGLSLGIDVAVRWSLDPDRMSKAARLRPDEVEGDLVRPTVDGLLYRAFAQHPVRAIFATHRAPIAAAIEAELRASLAADGVVVKSVAIGSVVLPAQYRAGLEALLAEELAAQKAKIAAETAGEEAVIAAKAQAEAMVHVLPLKKQEIEQKRLEAQAAKVQRLEQAEAEAAARRIEAGGEADARKKLAESDAYRLDVTGKATTDQMAREAALLKGNPLLIQKAMADKLSDKISVIIAPPNTNGFVGANLIGGDAKEEE